MLHRAYTIPLALTSILAAGLATAPAAGDSVDLDLEASVVAVLTHKAGLAAGLAHDHLIAAGDPEIELDFDPAAPGETACSLHLRSDALRVDDADLERRTYPLLEAWGLLDEPFAELSDKDRGKIRKAMLGKDQLAADDHPEISARLVALEESESQLGKETFEWRATVALTVRGKTIEKSLAARYRLDGEQLRIEAAGAFLFSDFGIEPYSALLGAVRNQDTFHLVLRLVGRVEGDAPAQKS